MIGAAPRFSALALSGLASLACTSSTETGALISLVPDPGLNSEEEVRAGLVRLQLLFDTNEVEFSNVETLGSQGSLTAVDADADGIDEILFEVSVEDRTDLPIVRVDPGTNQDVEIGVEARGLSSDGVVLAFGGVKPAKIFSPGQLAEVRVPFNLGRANRPPRVLAVTPTGLRGEHQLHSIAFYASKPLDATSLIDHVRVLLRTNAGDTSVLGSVVGPRSCPFGTEMWVFVPDACHDSGPFSEVKLVLDPEVKDTKGSSILGPNGASGHTELIDVLITSFGACPITKSCEGYGRFESLYGIDAICNTSSSLFEPAPCSIASGGCPGTNDIFDWVGAKTSEECAEIRPGSTLFEDLCVATKAWACSHSSDCMSLPGRHCTMSSGFCSAGSCEPGSCGDPQLVCTPQGCLPKIGGCQESCASFGACADPSKECIALEPGGHVCR